MIVAPIVQQVLFQEKLWSFKMPDHEHWKKQIEQILLIENNKDIHKYITTPPEECNIKAFRTSWDSHKKYPAIAKICNIIKDVFLKEIVKMEKYLMPHLQTTDSWINSYKKNNYAVPHVHYPHTLSTVYFVKVPKDSCKFLVYNSNNWRIKSDLDENKEELSINAPEGNVIVFKGQLLHSVTPNLSDKQRITMAANYHPTYDEKREETYG
tara:strand:- start:1344 stop:1973 length:630 start_codon:yes stop_codon:yes gene_type:complete